MSEGADRASPHALSYGEAVPALMRVTALQVATWCGAIPLATGLTVFVGWLLTGWAWLPTAGLCVMVAGFTLFIIGAAALARHVVRVVRNGHPRPRSFLRDVGLCGLLLLVNFPVAAWCARTATSIMFAYVVTVTNSSNTPIQSFVVSGPRFSAELAPIPPGKSVSYLCRIAGDGQLSYSASHGGVVTSGVINGYVSRGTGADDILTVSAPGVITQGSQSRTPLQKWNAMR